MPAATRATSASAASAVAASRSSRTRCVRSICRCSASGSSRWSSTFSPVGLGVAVDADDHPLARLDVRVPAKRRLLDLALDVPLLDRCDGAAQLVDVLDQLERALLELVRQRLDEEGAAERVGRVRRAALVREHLLRAERDPGRVLGRERERLVEAVRVQALRAAADRRERLDRDPHDVVLGLLRGQGRTAGLGVEAERERLRVRGAEAVAHQRRPQPPRGAELRHLLEEVVVRVEEEGEARAELVRREAGFDRRLRSRRSRSRA